MKVETKKRGIMTFSYRDLNTDSPMTNVPRKGSSINGGLVNSGMCKSHLDPCTPALGDRIRDRGPRRVDHR